MEKRIRPSARAGIGSKAWANLKMRPHISVIKIRGILEKFDAQGRRLWVKENTVSADFKKLSCQGAATGTFNAVNKAKLTMSDVSTSTEDATLVAGGDGSVDYATFEIEYFNESGGPKTVNQVEMGYDIDGGGEKIYFTTTGLSDVVADDEKVRYRYTITFAYVSGGVTALYRKSVAQMIATGSFVVPSKMNFVDTGDSDNCETATLDAGGDGVETYHQWTADYTGPVGGNTIDKLYLNKVSCTSGNEYAQEDIVNKAVGQDEVLSGFIKIEHT